MSFDSLLKQPKPVLSQYCRNWA